MKKSIIAILLFSILIITGCDEPSQTAGIVDPQEAVSIDQDAEHLENTYPVTRVVDGDTIIVNIDGADERVRLIGVDTPESVHPDRSKNVKYGQIASDFTREHLEGENVALEYDVSERDRYGRILAYVYLDEVMFNKTLLEEGHAKVATFPPNVKYVDDFTVLQEQARKDRKGVWGYDVFNESNESNGSNENIPAVKKDSEIAYTYIGNSNSAKFHKEDCRHAKQIAVHNVVKLESREDAISGGYASCRVCNP